jgi:hypothetical protein
MLHWWVLVHCGPLYLTINLLSLNQEEEKVSAFAFCLGIFQAGYLVSFKKSFWMYAVVLVWT